MAIYAIDFDNTLAITRFPEIIAPNKKMVAFAKTVKAQGHQIILWTSRAGADLENAVEWCRLQGLVFDAVNEPLPEQIKRWDNDTRKIYADYYIDDKNMTIPKLKMPYYPRQDKKGEIPYTILTRPEKLVMDYCHINIYEVQEMEIDIYLFFLREAMIFENSQTEEGRKYLKDCFRMEQTKPDREGLRERFGKKGGKSSG